MKHLFIILFLLSCCFAAAQVVSQGSREKSDETNNMVLNRGMEKQTVFLMAIGIKEFKDKTFAGLQSVDSMKMLYNYKTISNNYLPLSYKNHPQPFFMTGYVKKDAIIKDLRYLSESVDESCVVIISALSHGVIDKSSGEYYFICSDTSSDNYAGTAISGKELRFYFEKMANKGAVVLVFWDTCHSGALFDNQKFSPRSNGSVVYFASSRRNQESQEIYKQCKFTKTVMDVFLNKNEIFFDQLGFATIGSFMKVMPRAIDTQIQNVTFKAFSNDTNIGEVPIIKKKIPLPSPSIWQHPKAFSPIAVSPNKSKWLDYGLIGVESASLIGMIVCGPILQPSYKDKIKNESNVFLRNEYRQKGKNAAIGFCISTGLLVSSYLCRTIHVHKQISLEEKKKQYVSLNIIPIVSKESNGLALVLNF